MNISLLCSVDPLNEGICSQVKNVCKGKQFSIMKLETPREVKIKPFPPSSEMFTCISDHLSGGEDGKTIPPAP